MPNFNGEKFIRQSIQSVLNQTFSDFELIIIDDASTDKSLKIVSNFFVDKRINLVAMKMNKGVSASRNIGIASANGSYITFIDSDDLWLPEKLSIQISVLESQPKYVACHSDCYVFTGEKIELISTKKVVSQKNMWFQNHIPNLTGIYNVDKCGKVYQPNLRHEDYCMWHDVLSFGSSIGIQCPLALHRRHEANLTRDKITSLKWHYFALRKHFKLSRVLSFGLTLLRSLSRLVEVFHRKIFARIDPNRKAELIKRFEIL